MNCKHCGECEVDFVKASEPHSLEHFRCPECNSTFGFGMYEEVFEEELVISLRRFIWRRAGAMYGVSVSIKQLCNDYGKTYMMDFIKRHDTVFLIYNDSLLRKDMIHGD